MSPADGCALAAVRWRERTVEVEHEWIAPERGKAPLVVFLHEGLGSVAMWKDFPQRLCAAGGFRGLVYSRPGYGHSTPRAPEVAWGVDFMHQQAQEVLPAFLRAVGVGEPVWLFGHSDGASIALLYAATFPHAVHGLVVLAPHIFVEDLTVRSIELARDAYERTDLRQRLARYHADPDSAFRGWSRAWLNPQFRAWTIEPALAAVRAPVMAVQGLDDQYGTLAQVRGIADRVPGTLLLELPDCAHSPHRDQPDTVIAQAVAFIQAAGKGG